MLVAAIAVPLAALSCQYLPQALEAPTMQPSDVPTSQPSETPAAAPGIEMIEPTATFALTQVSTDTISATLRPRPTGCPHLESRLYDLTVAEDPAGFAQTMDLFYEGGATRVVIQLATPGADTSFLAEYAARIETQTESLVQALVPAEELCDLSNDPQVKFVRGPSAPESP